jgi:uncharacterized repeat protein (TIGR01451 family)
MLGFLILLLGPSYQAKAQFTFPRTASFQENPADGYGFTLGGTPNRATLTAATGVDPSGQGYLRLTNNELDQSGYAIDQATFPAPDGFSISFEFFAYGGTGADGFTVFLVDGDQTNPATFTPGASGGSLGYAQKTVRPTSNGVPFGYLGIGIDEFGNYSNATEGRVGGINTPNLTPDAVAIRGAGRGTAATIATDYPYLAGTQTLPFSLDVATRRAQITSSNPVERNDYRRAYIDVIPVTVDGVRTYRITVRIQHGLSIQTAVSNVLVPAPPPRLRIGFAGSTGGSTNFHEIRALQIRRTPFLNDDVVSTDYNQPVSVKITGQASNDLFPYAIYDERGLGSTDINFTAPGIQNELILPEGTLRVAPDGTATFTPSGTFAGVLTIPYTAADLLGERGAPANLIIIVRGADVVNTVSGPTAAGPGARIEYTVTTSNVGPLTATNVVPTLQLAPGLSGVVVPNGAYNSGTGLVTFNPTASLASGSTPVTNTVSFLAPLNGSVTGTTGPAPRVATQADPVAANNISSITTLISGLADPSSVCGVPGNDGVGSLDATSAPNTYFPGQAVGTTSGVSTITLGPALTGSGAGATPIAIGDLVLIMQMQGANLNTSNTSAYGRGGDDGRGNLIGPGDQFTAGLYEFAVAASAVPAGGGSLTLNRTLTNAYSNQNYTDGGNGQRRFQVIRVPQYSALTINGTVTGAAWNGTAGGVLALDVAGRTTFGNGARLDMNGKGFRGGAGRAYLGITSLFYTNTDFRQLSSATSLGSGGAKGEGTAGTPHYVNNNGVELNTGVEGYANGSNGRGAPGNAGGGGTDLTPFDNSRNTGGGGGANGGDGGLGGFGQSYRFSTTDFAQGIGGAAFGASAGRLALGGGGGAGVSNIGDGLNSSGAAGGGIVVLRTSAVAGTGRVEANGADAPTAGNDGGGGGGAGGSVLLLAATPNTLSTVTASATGGRGGNTNERGNGGNDNNFTANAYGPGGGGGGGVVLSNGAIAGNASSVAGGASGTTTNRNNNAEFGATAGNAGLAQTNAAASGSGTSECLPILTLALTAAPNFLDRTGSSTSPISQFPLYTLNVANTGGAARGVFFDVNLQNDIFKYDGTYTPIVTLRLAGSGTSFPYPAGYSTPANGVSQLRFGGSTAETQFNIPAGATLSITFRATIEASARNDFAYQANAGATYTNPLRTSAANATVQPRGNYNGPGTDTSLGAAGGSNYSASTSPAEDVTIRFQPLPVSLARFTAVALRLDAQLRWTTASEQNNDRFVVERSLDGSSFEAIGNVRGQGESSKPVNYEFIDVGAARLTASNKPVFYRLRQVDFDGTATYSPVRQVLFGAKGAVTVYPNPAGTSATLDLSGLPTGDYAVQILDLTGRKVANYSLPGAAQHPLDLQSLAAGTYMVRVRGGAINQSLLITRE